MSTLNLGILAHVDAGKTSLTERLLHAAGVIDTVGRVDDGTTTTDTLALERRRGITIKAAVACFPIGDVTVNVIDTPGHPDFIAEVERSLAVLDGAVLVVSAVEGVQAQTRVLFRALQRLGLPTLFFVNKIDRAGARPEAVEAEIAQRLVVSAVAMGTVRGPGVRSAAVVPYAAADPAFTDRLGDVLGDLDDEALAAVVDEAPDRYHVLRRSLAARSREGKAHPTFFGSAVTGAGVAELMAGLTEFLPRSGDEGGPLSAMVFAVSRGPVGERVAHARIFTGTLTVRDRVLAGSRPLGRVTALQAFGVGSGPARERVGAGEIAQVHGLPGVRIGDVLGTAPPGRDAVLFQAPALETVVLPVDPADRARLHDALTELAAQDPLIGLRHDDLRGETSVSLYGEVQKEVIAATLAEEYGVPVDFCATTPRCLERPAGRGAAFELIGTDTNPFNATVGLQVSAAPVGSGVAYDLAVELGSMPAAFFAAVEQTVHATLGEGLHGWPVTDCTITMTHSGYWPRQSAMHGTFDASMSSTAGDFRHLTPLVLMSALRRAGTRVCEPVHRFDLEVPTDTVGAVLTAVARVRGVPLRSEQMGPVTRLSGDLPAARTHELRQRLPGLTRGEAVFDARLHHHAPVRGPVPDRPRTDHNPLRRSEYLLRVQRRVPG